MPRSSLISKESADYGDYTNLVTAIDACNRGKCGDCPYGQAGQTCISMGHSLRNMAVEAIRRLSKENARLKKEKFGKVMREYKDLIRELRAKAVLTHSDEMKDLLENAADSIEYLACDRVLESGGVYGDN